MDELNTDLKSSIKKSSIIRKYVGGTCTVCAGIPSKKIKYDPGDGIKLVEWYRDSCFARLAH